MRTTRIDVKLTLWYTFFMSILLLSSIGILLYANQRFVLESVRQRLGDIVSEVAKEIQVFSAQEELPDNDDTYILYQNEYVEIDDDYVSEKDSVYTAIYSDDHMLIYGNSLLSDANEKLSFSNAIKDVEYRGKPYYVYDIPVENHGLHKIWVRGVIEQTQVRESISKIFMLAVYILPIIMLITLAVGYFLAKKTLQPIERMRRMAMQISTGKDLSRQIDIGKGNDELHRLADTFNSMFDRLFESFEREKQFSGMASHELRTPMSVILAECEYLDQYKNSTEMHNDDIEKMHAKLQDYQEGIEVIFRQSKRMHEILNQLLDFTRIGLKDIQMSSLDFSALVYDICREIQDSKRDSSISLESDLEKDIFIHGNSGLLYRMLTNLILNAYKYGKENGHIYIMLSIREDHALLSVKDDGIGIASDSIKKIFEKFYRADTKADGVGLGLSMAKEIAKVHGGDIEVKSILGLGTEFMISIPLIKL